MTLTATPTAIYTEIEAAEEFRKEFSSSKPKMVRAYAGPFFFTDSDSANKDNPENFHYEYCSYMLPRLVYNNPRVQVKSRRVGAQRVVGEAIRHGLNRWCVDTDFRTTLVRGAVDYLFIHTVLLTTQEEDVRSLHESYKQQFGNKVPYLPRVTHIETEDFVFDPLGRTASDWRWAGHRFVRDKDDLLEEAKDEGSGWNREVLDELQELRDGKKQDDEPDRVSAPNRNEIVLYEVWYPEHYDEDKYDSAEEAAEDGFHGMIFTLAKGQCGPMSAVGKKKWVREPRPYYGPRWGPYSYIGAYPVPGESRKLSPLTAVEPLVRNLNQHARAVRDGAATYKRFPVVAGDDPKIAQSIKSAQHGHVLAVAGFTRDQVEVIEQGGLTAQQLESMALFKDQLDRNAGLGEAQRGATTSGATATETAVAANSSALRMDFIAQQWADGVTRTLRTVAWYLYHDDRVIFPLGEEASKDLGAEGAEAIIFEGGDFDTESGATFDDLELDIEPYSMERVDQGLLQRRTMELVGMVPNLVQMMAMAPDGVDWAALLDRIGDAFNAPGFGQLFYPDVIAQRMGAQAEPSGSEGPKLASTVGGPAGAPKGPQGASGGTPNPAQPQGAMTGAAMTVGAN